MTEEMLAQYSTLVDFLGQALGPDYEVVLHEILPENSRIAAIANGHISGRKVGAPITSSALRMIMQKRYEEGEYELNYTGQLPDGKTIRSSTMFIKDNGKLVGLLCINFDDSRFHAVSNAILRIVHPDSFVQEHYFPADRGIKQAVQRPVPAEAERFQSNTTGLMEEIFDTVMQPVTVPIDHLTQADRADIIARLYEAGLFELRGAVQFTVKKLACSQASIYRYLQKAKNAE